MADIVVVYAREDAAEIPAALETALHPMSVWWDAKLGAGDYRQQLEEQILQAGCLVPVWSKAARLSTVLHDEVETAIRGGVPVLPVRIHDTPPPMARGTLQLVDALGWRGEEDRGEIQVLKEKVQHEVESRRTNVQRPRSLHWAPQLTLPLFFFSVSSYETRLRPYEALVALKTFGAEAVLVSAYDFVARETGRAERREEQRLIDKMIESLNDCRGSGGLVLLDSGNYERGRKSDGTWKRVNFRSALRRTPHDLSFCFDSLDPGATAPTIARKTIDTVRRDESFTSSSVLPIVHVPRDQEGGYRTSLAPSVILEIAQTLAPPLIAIPERELGDGVLARLATMKAIRTELSRLNRYQPIHVLGTGTPVSIALLTAAGADSFDGLEWCRDVVDAEGKRFHHFHLFDFFRYQAELSASDVTARAQQDDAVRYTGKAVLHNLGFYADWLRELRESAHDGPRLASFLGELLPKGALRQVRPILENIL